MNETHTTKVKTMTEQHEARVAKMETDHAKVIDQLGQER
jgi:hypothetical protein